MRAFAIKSMSANCLLTATTGQSVLLPLQGPSSSGCWMKILSAFSVQTHCDIYAKRQALPSASQVLVRLGRRHHHLRWHQSSSTNQGADATTSFSKNCPSEWVTSVKGLLRLKFNMFEWQRKHTVKPVNLDPVSDWTTRLRLILKNGDSG